MRTPQTSELSTQVQTAILRRTEICSDRQYFHNGSQLWVKANGIANPLGHALSGFLFFWQFEHIFPLQMKTTSIVCSHGIFLNVLHLWWIHYTEEHLLKNTHIIPKAERISDMIFKAIFGNVASQVWLSLLLVFIGGMHLCFFLNCQLLWVSFF